ncbi:uncharacterized protein K441DRAFT_664807 [Cenococcum geophilum 1.58]|uniref:uncharacterized protein n=1 Tax=Cenococcum geophilum 1.58 TaxID=794803 RepID=UPI00358E30A6|nr:hypothetical protein K441DRAFT_664807 [Cenococcum geophilum 1.58]
MYVLHAPTQVYPLQTSAETLVIIVVYYVAGVSDMQKQISLREQLSRTAPSTFANR